MVTIYDIAKACNCAPATVSKAFNGYGSVSEGKKKEIMETARSMGYIVNSTARSLITKKSYMIGVVLSNSHQKNNLHELFSRILHKFRQGAEAEGYDICYISSDRKVSLLEKCRSRVLDGVFLLCCDYEDPQICELIESDVPTLCFDTMAYKPSISTDNVESIAALVDHLASLGHRKIVYIRCRESDLTQKRMEGYKKGLERNGIEWDENLIVQGEWYSENSVPEMVDRIFAQVKDFTAIMFPDDYTAIEAIKILKKKGYSVPEDISVTGFDGIELTRYTRPTITTIRQDSDTIGRHAIEMMLKVVEKKTTKSALVRFRLQAGESTAAAKK